MSMTDHHAARAPVPLDACGLAAAAQLLGDKWTLLVVRELFYGVVRFEDIRSDLGMSKSVLSDRLGRLVDAGVVETEPYQDAGARPRKAYRLSTSGRGLATSLLALKEWGEVHLQAGAVPWHLAHVDTGAVVQIRPVTADGAVVRLSDTRRVPGSVPVSDVDPA